MTSGNGRPAIDASRAGAEAPLNRLVVYGMFALCLAMLSILAMFPRGPFVIVVTNPADRPQVAVSIIAAADGLFVTNGITPWISLAYSDAPDFPARLMKAGAWIVLRGTVTSVCMKDKRIDRS